MKAVTSRAYLHRVVKVAVIAVRLSSDVGLAFNAINSVQQQASMVKMI